MTFKGSLEFIHDVSAAPLTLLQTAEREKSAQPQLLARFKFLQLKTLFHHAVKPKKLS